jgi:hypothetical protein
MFARFRDTDGSMILALLATFIIGALVVTLVSTTITGQRKVRHDRNFQLAINGADAGVNQALTAISGLPPGDSRMSLTQADLQGLNLADPVTQVGDVAFDWTAEKDTIISWRIRSVGERNDVERHVEALAVRDATFFLAAFADIGFGMKGGNEVRSYSATATNTGNGAVGSNGEIYSIGAGSSWADLIMLMGSGATCTGNICTQRPIVGFSQAFDLEAIADNIRQAMEEHCGGGFTAYDAGTGPALVGGNTYCFTDVAVPKQGGIPLASHSKDKPVVILMTGNLSTGNQASVNCPPGGCSMSNHPDASSLQIYSTGQAVRIGNHTELAGAIAAPYAACEGNPSVAQADLYGAIICNDLSNQGGWDFYFDDRLLNLGNGQYDVVEWREEHPTTSSFPS